MGCIGVDEVDDPIVGELIIVDQSQVALLVGDTTRLSARYFDQYGIEQNIQLEWEADNETVCSIDLAGVVTALSAGQSNITASIGSTESDPVLITVVNDANDVAQVTISSSIGNQIAIDQELGLDIEIFNLEGNPIMGNAINWESSDDDILEVDENGTILGISNGSATIRAIVDGIYSNALSISVGQTSRTGTFQGANGYDASGSTELFIADNGDLILTLSSDFSTDFALGTYIYLSNSTSGGATAAGGLEIQEVFSGGSATFNVSNIDPDIQITDYEYVIVLCKPAQITFGLAQLN